MGRQPTVKPKAAADLPDSFDAAWILAPLSPAMSRTESGGSPPAGRESGAVGDPIDRRRFLVLMGGAAVLAAATPRAASAGKDTPPRYRVPALPSDLPSTQVEVARALIGAAILAP